MSPVARSAAVLLLLVFTLSPAVADVMPDTVLVYSYPPAPTPGTVSVIVQRANSTGTRPLVAEIAFQKIAPIAGPVQHLKADPKDSLDPDRFVVTVGPLDVGRYVATPVPGGQPDGVESALEFAVTTTGLATVVEYYNASLGHYFITADPAEVAALDDGRIAGWSRTGQYFPALPADALPSNAQRVCRYYGRPEAGLDTHFFSEDMAECEAVAQRWPDKWILESDHAFGIDGAWSYYDYFCDMYNQPLYRLYNNRPDANHRYTTVPLVRDQMLSEGWVLEARHFVGSPDAFTTCVPLRPRSP